MLARAIFALTGTREYSDDEYEASLEKWLPTLERALSDALGNLINTFKKAVEEHQDTNVQGFDAMVRDLRDVAKLRNVLCHGFWGPPDAIGSSLPFYVDRNGEKFKNEIDADYLRRLQRRVTKLACSVIDTVSHMGWQFPGSSGPGKVVYEPRS